MQMTESISLNFRYRQTINAGAKIMPYDIYFKSLISQLMY